MHEFNWGLLIVVYLFLGGLSAGLFFAAGLANYLEVDGQPAYPRIARMGALLAPWPVAIGSGLLILDLGNWYRFYKLFIHFRWESPMSIGSWLLTAFTGIAFAYAFAWLPEDWRQKLFNKVRERKDLVVITLNTDENPGLILPFLHEKAYTFPVLAADAYVHKLVPELSIPRNWIVDPNGVLLTERRFDYPIVPDIRRPNATEIFSVDEVVSVRPDSQEPVRFEPFYSFRHGLKGSRGQVFWMASRRASGRRDDEGTEMFLSLVDLEQRPVAPDVDSLTVRLTCTNRDLPSRLPFGMESGDFELESGAPVHSIMALRKPTPALRPPTGKSSLWRLVSHLSLNYLSLVSEGREALQEILKLYNFTNSSYSVKQIEGITDLKSRPQFARIISENGITFARGTRVDMELDEENFVGGGAYLFASVIEHFLGLYVTLASFSQLSVSTRQRKEVLKLWPPRAGSRILL